MESTNTQRELALDVLRKLRDAGYETYWAGGCVRDQLLGIAPKDYDVATGATPEQVRELFGKRRTLAVGAQFGVIAVLGKKGHDPIEVATFRSDGAYVDGRRPAEVVFTTAEEDAERRDFTINGMFLDPLADNEEEQVVDYVGGREDLQQRTIRAIGDPHERFEEDKLRLLRAVRFAACYDFELDPVTRDAINEMANQVTVVSAERIGAELKRLLTHDNRARGVKLLAETRLLAATLPELANLPAEQSNWQSLLEVLSYLETQSLPTVLAALLAGTVTPLESKAICRRLRLTNQEGDQTAWLLAQLPLIDQAEALSWPKLQRILTAPGSEELMQLASATWPADHRGLGRCQELLQLPPEQLNPPSLVSGDDLISHGIAPGKHFSTLLEFLRDEQLEGRLHTLADSLTAADQWIARHQP
ncbi:CCA tRNA nucleotidyltransferase [Adhaeretor mobilis]|uniref:tRNA nucleotidyltransferase/poly(A) polymerase n=1 Tax=Adhaeretor mobilis TaxID=1930276 RepID=A0A517MUC1_9BACT|nr:CCA tRNA nucleotidyltransferase [Adhaeretor mobilis]QDS98387.1 tRNA nucleotidyltransferase/poly(A) polymerase [Adhaeretor mobilis]